MVLVQFFITEANNGLWHSININGPCSARLVNYTLVHANNHYIQLQSDVFKTPYSANTFNNLNLCNGVILSNSTVAFDQSHRDFHWNNIVIPGRVQWTVIDLETSAPLAGNFNLILTFDMEELP